MDLKIVKRAIFEFQNDLNSLEKVLQKYVINQLFIKNAHDDEIEVYNNRIDIQWAIDLKNQLPN